jgi:hypothetical protein
MGWRNPSSIHTKRLISRPLEAGPPDPERAVQPIDLTLRVARKPHESFPLQ